MLSLLQTVTLIIFLPFSYQYFSNMTTKFVNYTTPETSHLLAYLTNDSNVTINPDIVNYSNKFENSSAKHFENVDNRTREQIKSINISNACQDHKVCGNAGLNLTTPINLLNISALSEKIQENGVVETQVQSSKKNENSDNSEENVDENLLSTDTQTEIKGYQQFHNDNKIEKTLSNQSTHKSESNDLSLNPSAVMITANYQNYSKNRNFTRPITTSQPRTSPLQFENFQESNSVRARNLNSSQYFQGSSLQSVWETTSQSKVADNNLDGESWNLSTVLPFEIYTTKSVKQGTTIKPRSFGVVKYPIDTNSRSSSKPFLTTFSTLTVSPIEIASDLDIGKSVIDELTTVNTSDSVTKVIQQEIPWPVKKEAIVEGDLVLGGLMMVHEREDTITCGPVMPQGGIQALEAMLYALDRLNYGPEALLPNITLGAHILDDCDKDTYGLEMAVDFIKVWK